MFFFAISFVICSLGALAGIGGGMLLKPILESTTDLSILSINALSAITVIAMTCSALCKQRKHFKLPLSIAFWIGLGAIIGGYMGQGLFSLAWKDLNEHLLRLGQDSMLFLIVLVIIIYETIKKRSLKKEILNVQQIKVKKSIFIGMGLGSLASFLSIGGGPFNKPIIERAFSTTSAQAASISLVIILFSQSIGFVSMLMTHDLDHIDWHLAPMLILGAILGGMCGGWLLQHLSEHSHQKIFIWILYAIALLNLYNISAGFF